MSQYFFGLYNGHLTARLVKRVEAEYPDVAVINYTEPNGHKRGWFSGPNLGAPFDGAMARDVMAFAHKIATGRDRDVLEAAASRRRA